MKRFLNTVLLIVIIPLGGLALVYFTTDPYKTLKPFSLDYFDSTNRDYLSSELFLLNYSDHKYDSFIFGSSRGCGINTYHWAMYLPKGSRQYLFQAWSETITGIEQKIKYIDTLQYGLRNAIILIDIPSTFTDNQSPTEAMTIKDPHFSKQPIWKYQLCLLFDFLQKPSQWIRAIKGNHPVINFDTVSNDWNANNRYADLSIPPKKDSLNSFSSRAKSAFLLDNSNKTDKDILTSDPVIGFDAEQQLRQIKRIFDNNKTDYRIIITPGYCYSYPSISPVDLSILQTVFGAEYVFDFSGRNYLTDDYNNFSDPNHFGQYVGWEIIESIYN